MRFWFQSVRGAIRAISPETSSSGRGRTCGGGPRWPQDLAPIPIELEHDIFEIADEKTGSAYQLNYLPFSQAGGALLFHLIGKLYEHTSCDVGNAKRYPQSTG